MSFCTGSVLRCNTKDTAALLADDKFVALEEEVTIVPSITTDEEIDCINARLGPFRAQLAHKVPLWAALEMDRQFLCTIEPPPWLTEAGLKKMKEEEKAQERLATVPYHYMEVAFAFLEQSRSFEAGSGKQVDALKLHLRELIQARRRKITDGMRQFDALNPAEYDVTYFSAAELTCFRTRTFHALDSFLDLLKTSRKLGNNSADLAGDEGEDSMGFMDDSTGMHDGTTGSGAAAFGPSDHRQESDSFGPSSS